MSNQGNAFYTTVCIEHMLRDFSIAQCRSGATMPDLDPRLLWMRKVQPPGIRIILFVRGDMVYLRNMSFVGGLTGQQSRYLGYHNCRAFPPSQIGGAIWVSRCRSILVTRRVGARHEDNPEFALCCRPGVHRRESMSQDRWHNSWQWPSNYMDHFADWSGRTTTPDWIPEHWWDLTFFQAVK